MRFYCTLSSCNTKKLHAPIATYVYRHAISISGYIRIPDMLSDVRQDIKPSLWHPPVQWVTTQRFGCELWATWTWGPLLPTCLSSCEPKAFWPPSSWLSPCRSSSRSPRRTRDGGQTCLCQCLPWCLCIIIHNIVHTINLKYNHCMKWCF